MYPQITLQSKPSSFRINWSVVYHDLASDYGTLTLTSQGQSPKTTLVGTGNRASWKAILPILVREMEISPEPPHERYQFTPPQYDQAAFTMSEGEVTIFYSTSALMGGVGSFTLRMVGGTPTIRCSSPLSRNTILQILENIDVSI